MSPTVAIALTNLAALRARLAASAVVVVGVAGVVFVLTAMLAMANGLSQTLRATGAPDRVLILGRGSHSEINGSITRAQAAIIANAPGIATSISPHGDREPLASPEIYATANLARRDDGRRAGLPLRGIGDAAYRVRPEVKIVAGRGIEPGRFELLVGAGAARVFAGLDVGHSIEIKGVPFRVVGRFTADGGATESEGWMDVDAMASVFRRGPYLQSVRVRLESPDALDRLRAALDADRRLATSVFRESDFYAAQAQSSTRLIALVGATAGVVMALGATFAALNALYAAVAARTREIATLRAIGFSGAAVVASVMAESTVLALVGGALGAALGWLAFDGAATSSVGATYSQVAFRFSVTPKLIALGVVLALVVGLLGGAWPALRAARMSIVDGLRSAG